MTRRLLYILLLYLAVGMQISLATPLPGLGWDIDIVLLFLVIIATKVGHGEAVIWAMFAGLALDVFDPSAMGGCIVAKSTAIFLFGVLSNALNLEQPTLLAVTIFVLTLIDRIIYRLFSPYSTQFGWAFLRFDLPSAAVTAIAGLIVLLIAIRMRVFTPRTVEE